MRQGRADAYGDPVISFSKAKAIVQRKVPPMWQEDAVQEAVIRSWQAEGTGHEITAAHRAAIDFYRWQAKSRYANPKFVPLDDLDFPIDSHEQDVIRSVDVDKAIFVLPPDQRMLVVLHYWRDLSQQAIGELCGYPQTKVSLYLGLAREAMRKRLTT